MERGLGRLAVEPWQFDHEGLLDLVTSQTCLSIHRPHNLFSVSSRRPFCEVVAEKAMPQLQIFLGLLKDLIALK